MLQDRVHKSLELGLVPSWVRHAFCSGLRRHLHDIRGNRLIFSG